MKKKLLLASVGFTIFCSHFASATDSLSSTISPEVKKKAEEVIVNCEKTYQNVKEQGKQLDNIKKPTLFGSKKVKEAYKNKETYKKVFNLRFAEFAKFTNDKIKIRTARNPSDLRDSVAAYSSNCTRFSDGLIKFVDWAAKGKSIDKTSETIFRDWMKDVK